ncbi:MAG: NrsF family protein [Vicinamibacterales bacterium]
MKTEDLIVQLAGAAGPVRPLHRPGIRFLRWFAASVPFAVAFVILVGPRPDLANALGRRAFLASTSLMIATSLIAAGAALATGVPGRERAWAGALPPALAAVWAGLLLAWLAPSGAPEPRLAVQSLHLLCIVEIAAIGLAPAIGLFAMLRRAAPLRPGWSALLASLAGLSLGTAATEFLCPISIPIHLVFGHALPAATLTVLAALAGRSRLAWLR